MMLLPHRKASEGTAQTVSRETTVGTESFPVVSDFDTKFDDRPSRSAAIEKISTSEAMQDV